MNPRYCLLHGEASLLSQLSKSRRSSNWSAKGNFWNDRNLWCWKACREITSFWSCYSVSKSTSIQIQKSKALCLMDMQNPGRRYGLLLKKKSALLPFRYDFRTFFWVLGKTPRPLLRSWMALRFSLCLSYRIYKSIMPIPWNFPLIFSYFFWISHLLYFFLSGLKRF